MRPPARSRTPPASVPRVADFGGGRRSQGAQPARHSGSSEAPRELQGASNEPREHPRRVARDGQ
eukprot:9244380-Pyramimonas_sp.AAC.1